MNNYWLTEYNKNDSSADPEDDMPEDSGDEEMGPKDKLNERQSMMYDYYESIVEEFGLFDQTSKGDGAHYAPAKKNPFIAEGMICANCVFFEGGQACEIVTGTIEPNAICKLWIIPEDLITIKR